MSEDSRGTMPRYSLPALLLAVQSELDAQAVPLPDPSRGISWSYLFSLPSPLPTPVGFTTASAISFRRTLRGLDWLRARGFRVQDRTFLERLHSEDDFVAAADSQDADVGFLALACHRFPGVGFLVVVDDQPLPGLVYHLDPVKQSPPAHIVILHRHGGVGRDIWSMTPTLADGHLHSPSALPAYFEQTQLYGGLPLAALIPEFAVRAWWAHPEAKRHSVVSDAWTHAEFWAGRQQLSDGTMIQSCLWEGLSSTPRAVTLLHRAFSINDRAFRTSLWPVFVATLSNMLRHLGVRVSQQNFLVTPAFFSVAGGGAVTRDVLQALLARMHFALLPDYDRFYQLVAHHLLYVYGQASLSQDYLPLLTASFQLAESTIARPVAPVAGTLWRVAPELAHYRLSRLTAHRPSSKRASTTEFELTAKVMLAFLTERVLDAMPWNSAYYLADLYIPWRISEVAYHERHRSLVPKAHYRHPQFLESVFRAAPEPRALSAAVWVLPLTVRGATGRAFSRVLLIFHHVGRWIEYYDPCAASDVLQYVQVALRQAAHEAHPGYAQRNLRHYQLLVMNKTPQAQPEQMGWLPWFVMLSLQNSSLAQAERLRSFLAATKSSAAARAVGRELFVYAHVFLREYRGRARAFLNSPYSFSAPSNFFLAAKATPSRPPGGLGDQHELRWRGLRKEGIPTSEALVHVID